MKPAIIVLFLISTAPLWCHSAQPHSLPPSYQAVIQAPYSPRALSDLGLWYYRRKGYTEALQLFLLAEQTGSPGGFLYQMQGRCWMQLGRPDLALSVYEKGLRLSPGDSWMYSGHATALYQLGRYPDALLSWKKALARTRPLPDSLAFIFTQMGKCSRALQDYPAALLYLEEALDYQDGYWVRYEYAGTWSDQGDLSRAVKEYSLARKYQDQVDAGFRDLAARKQARTLFELGWQARLKKDWTAARSYFETILKDKELALTPEGEKARFWLNRLPQIGP